MARLTGGATPEQERGPDPRLGDGGTTMPGRIIGIDWGTTTFRAYRLNAAGKIRDSVASDRGILTVADGDFEGAFESQVGGWLAEDSDAMVVACGMLGSRQGWYEVPYLSCPAGPGDLAAGLWPLRLRRGRTLWLVPGLTCRDEAGIPDVMRGEETQIAGCLEAHANGRTIFVLPGTHSKWAVVDDGRVIRFATFMTGEMFSVLCRHSILGRLMANGPDDAQAFGRGLEQSRAREGALLANLFSVRTLGLFGDMAPDELRPYLSGLLIGAEVGAALRTIGVDHGIVIVGEAELALRYETALKFFGADPHVERADHMLSRGLAVITAAAESAGVIP